MSTYSTILRISIRTIDRCIDHMTLTNYMGIISSKAMRLTFRMIMAALKEVLLIEIWAKL